MIAVIFPVKKAACFTLMLFTWGIMDIPVWAFSGSLNPKTCCGRSICECTHPKGAICPLRNKVPETMAAAAKVVEKKPAARMPCHFPGHETVEKESQPSPKASFGKDIPVFKKAPCHSEKTQAVHFPSSKKILSYLPVFTRVTQGSERWYPFAFDDYDFLFVTGIDHPPKAFLSL